MAKAPAYAARAAAIRKDMRAMSSAVARVQRQSGALHERTRALVTAAEQRREAEARRDQELLAREAPTLHRGQTA